ncbi:MAG: dihydropteroate synthase [Bacteroidales bacterium]|jgi:5-methyltetrahydrofolate--homocysteine methyltransferase|nr:dihydropteroate synthase [Bacteroidales bacterium]
MKTFLSGKTKEVVIDTDGPVVIIGECINPTRRKRLVSSLQDEDFRYMLELAQSQINAGAEILDVNVGYPGVDDEKLLPKAVIALQDQFDIPLCLDSPNHMALEAALKVVRGKCLINSVNAEETSLRSLLPLARQYGAAIIGLTLDDEGITHDPEQRLRIAEKIADRAVRAGIKQEDVIIDPMAMAVSADPYACRVTLETIRLVHDRMGHNITQGASNISFGLPDREDINNAFMAMSILYGLTCPIANPEKITGLVRAADLVLARDDFAIRFIEHYQSKKS